MCNVTLHAQSRARERWSIQTNKAVQEIKDSYERAMVVGEFVGDDMKPRKLLLDARHQRVIVINPDEDSVITCWRTKNTPLAKDMYDSVISLHRRRINVFSRKWKTLMKQYNANKIALEAEREAINAEISRLKLRRDHISAQLDNYVFDLRQVNEHKKLTLHSLCHYLTYEESEYAKEGVN